VAPRKVDGVLRSSRQGRGPHTGVPEIGPAPTDCCAKLLRVRKGCFNTASDTSPGANRLVTAGAMPGAWHLYVKSACSPHSICAASSVIYSLRNLFIERRLTDFVSLSTRRRRIKRGLARHVSDG